jgi:hypothetical protein
LKIPGKNAGSGSISRLGRQFIDCPPRIIRPSASSGQNSNREGIRLETVVNQRKQTSGIDSNREKGAVFSPSKFDRTTRQRPRWGSRARTPTSGVAGASIGAQSQRRLTQAAPRGEGNGNGGAENRAGLEDQARPYDGRDEGNGNSNGERQKRRLAACATGCNIDGCSQLASNKIFEVKQREKRVNDPSNFVSVRKNSVLCFEQLTQNLNDTMFRLERIAERTNCKGGEGDVVAYPRYKLPCSWNFRGGLG